MVDELAYDTRVIAEATVGPWKDAERYGAIIADAVPWIVDETERKEYGGTVICESSHLRNRAFITRARTRYPELVVEVRELRKQKMAAEAALARLLSCTHGDKDRCGCRLPVIEYFNALPSVSSEVP